MKKVTAQEAAEIARNKNCTEAVEGLFYIGQANLAEIINEALEAALKAGDVQAPKEGWISVEERLPDNGQRVAFVADINKDSVYHYMHGEVFGGVFRLDDGNALFSYPGHSMYASHWMPLLAAPTDKEGK